MKNQTRSSLLILGFCLATCLACQTSWGSAKSLQGDQAPKGWIAHQDPAGFSVQFPRGWQARTDRSSGQVELQGQEGEQLFVWPIFIPGQSRQNAESASFGKQTASSVLQKLATNLWPKAAWEMPQSAGAASMRMRGRDGGRLVLSIFTWVNSPKGS